LKKFGKTEGFKKNRIAASIQPKTRNNMIPKLLTPIEGAYTSNAGDQTTMMRTMGTT
jgi:hypothetical protein